MKKVLVIVDIQRDFCSQGPLPVPNAEKIIPNVNKLTNSGLFDMIVATQDYHCPEHKTAFQDWPIHCVAGTEAAEFHPDLDQSKIQTIIRKGMNPEVDSYSGFFSTDQSEDTGLKALIDNLEDDVQIYITGLALEVCVYNTAKDAKAYFDDVTLILDACGALSPESAKKTEQDLMDLDIEIGYTTEEVIND